MVEPFYAHHGQRPAVQVAPAHALADLDKRLEGWERRIEVDVLVADRAAVAASADTAGIAIQDHWDPTWLSAWARAEGRDDVDVHARAVFPRIRHATAFAMSPDGAGVGLAVAGEGWAGIFSMATHPDSRGRGVGAQTLAALAAWSPAERLFLQVEPGNAAAQRLYERAGFTHSHAYHYRMGC